MTTNVGLNIVNQPRGTDFELVRTLLGGAGGLEAGQAVRQFGTRAANLARGEEASEAALARRQVETAEQIVAVLGTMKGAAMKLGQVMSFLDVGLVPEEYRDHVSYEPHVVPPGKYFVLGDHRSSSSDSRTWGFVKREAIYGKAVFVYWPLDKMGRLH